MNEIRKRKIEREIQKTLATLILTNKVKDPRITLATFHRVELSKDLSEAIVYYTAICSNNERKKLISGLVSASGYLQSVIGKKLGLRRTPRLKFVWDKEYIKSLEVNRLIDESAPRVSSYMSSFPDSEEDESEDDRVFADHDSESVD